MYLQQMVARTVVCENTCPLVWPLNHGSLRLLPASRTHSALAVVCSNPYQCRWPPVATPGPFPARPTTSTVVSVVLLAPLEGIEPPLSRS